MQEGVLYADSLYMNSDQADRHESLWSDGTQVDDIGVWRGIRARPPAAIEAAERIGGRILEVRPSDWAYRT